MTRIATTTEPTPRPAAGRQRGRGMRPWLIQLKILGLVGFLGGLFCCGCMWAFGPVPEDAAGWLLLKGTLRAVFFPSVFCGLVITIIAGIALYSRHWREFNRMRWFRLKALLLAIFIPATHLTARGRVTAMYEAIESNELARAEALWSQVGIAFLVTFAIMIAIAAVGRMKPRLGEPIGARRSVPERAAVRARMQRTKASMGVTAS